MCCSRDAARLALLLVVGCGSRNSIFDDGGPDGDSDEHLPCSDAILIPAGDFTMGLPGPIPDVLVYDGSDHCEVENVLSSDNGFPAHVVSQSEYYISRFEVTAWCYAQCLNAGECSVNADSDMATLPEDYLTSARYADRPMVALTFRMAEEYCAFRGGRLPTESEWEKAARGPDGWAPRGEDIPCEQANVWSAPEQRCDVEGPIRPEGSLPAPIRDFPDDRSPYGLQGVLGGAHEWVSDSFDQYYYQVSGPLWVDPAGPERARCEDYRQVERGGVFYAVYSPLTDRLAPFCHESDCYTSIVGVDGARCAWDEPPP